MVSPGLGGKVGAGKGVCTEEMATVSP